MQEFHSDKILTVVVVDGVAVVVVWKCQPRKLPVIRTHTVVVVVLLDVVLGVVLVVVLDVVEDIVLDLVVVVDLTGQA